MHILYIHQYFATPHGSTGTRSYEFARRWVQAGHRVTVVTSTAQLTAVDLQAATGRLVRKFKIEGVDILAIDVAYRQSMGHARRMFAFLTFMVLATWTALCVPKVDIVYATSTPLTIGIPAMAFKWIRRRPFVFEVRDVWPAVPIAIGVIRSPMLIALLNCLERVIYHQSSAIITLSPGMQLMVQSTVKCRRPVFSIPNSSDIDSFGLRKGGPALRLRKGWNGKTVFIYTGAMGRANGLGMILRVAEHFERKKDFHFVLLGEGGEKNKLRAEKDRLELDNIEILDAVPKEQLAVYLDAADICMALFASFSILEDNSANKFFDYLSAGKPILLNYSGWQRDLLESSHAGLGCTLGNLNEFIKNIERLGTDASQREVMGKNARTLAVERFNRDLLAAQALEVVRNAYFPAIQRP